MIDVWKKCRIPFPAVLMNGVYNIYLFSIHCDNYYKYLLLTILHTINLALLQEQYYRVQDFMTTPWPLTWITHNMTKIKTQLQNTYKYIWITFSFFFKLHIIQSILQIQLYTSLILGSAQLASLLITLKTKYGNNYREKYKSRIKIMM